MLFKISSKYGRFEIKKSGAYILVMLKSTRKWLYSLLWIDLLGREVELEVQQLEFYLWRITVTQSCSGFLPEYDKGFEQITC